MKLLATTLNGQMMIREVNPNQCAVDNIRCQPKGICECSQFTNSHTDHIADIPGLKDGAILDSEDVDLVWQCRTINGDWVVIDSDTAYGLDNSGYKTRQAYILKSQPSLNEDKEQEELAKAVH